MAPFNSHLESILADLQFEDDDRRKYAEDYNRIRDFVTSKLCETAEFKRIFGGTDLFGSTSNNVRIIVPNERDVMVVLNMFGGSNGVKVKLSADSPGFVTLDCSSAIQQLRWGGDSLFNFMERIVNRGTGYLNKKSLGEWLEGLFEKSFKNFPKIKGVEGDMWSLKYRKGDVAFKVEATTGNKKEISIDFVPGIKLYGDSWPYTKDKGIFKTETDYWYACLKNSYNLDKIKGATEFQVVNPRAEKIKMLDKYNLKPVYRLLKAFRNKKKLYKIKSYFLTTWFLFEIDSQNINFWEQPLANIFVHMLGKLLETFKRRHLSYYWAEKMNLLIKLETYEWKDYENILNSSYQTFLMYPRESLLTLKKCRSHFLTN